MQKNYSVLMSVYFKEKPIFLKESIESILSQTKLTNDFIIVCDGILTKELDLILNDFCEKYKFIKLIKLKQNVGLGRALNEGLKYCKNDLVARMDSDDIAFSKRCELQMEMFDKDEDIKIIGGDIIEIDPYTKEKKAYKKVPYSYEDILNYSKYRNPFNHMTVMFSKQAILNVGGYKDMPLAEDYYLWVRLLKEGYKGLNINTPLVYARTGEDMYYRRGGFSYAKKILHFRYTFLKMKYTNLVIFLLTTLPHMIVAIIPNKIRGYIYTKLLRER